MAVDATNPAQQTQTTDESTHLKELNQKLQGKIADLEKRYSGIDPEEFSKLKIMREDYELMRKQQAVGDPKKFDEELTRRVQEAEEAANKRYGSKLTEYEQELGTTKSELNRLRVVNPAMQKAATVFNTDALELVQSVIEKELEWNGNGIVVKGADGKPRASAKDPRKQMDLEEYLEGVANKYPSLAKAKGKPGTRDSGMTTSANGASNGGGVTLEQYQRMSEAERRLIPPLERGRLAAANLRANERK